MYIFLIIIFILSMALFFWMMMRDRKYLQKPTKQALGKELNKEINNERALFSSHQARFEKALDRARQKRQKGQGS